MSRSSVKERARGMLRDAIISLCREAIPHKEEITVEGLLGITVDQKDVFLVTIQEMLGGGQTKKKRKHSTDSMGLTVKSVEGNSSVYYDQSDSGEDAAASDEPQPRKRKYKSAMAVKAKRMALSNGSALEESGKEETVNVLGESVQIKQEKPDSDDEMNSDNNDTGDWQLCVDQQQASNDEALANEVLEMSAENLRSFTPFTSVTNRRGSQVRFHQLSQQYGDHRPHLIPPTARRSHPQKRCRVCYRQGLRKESRYCCPVCPGYPGLCVVPCFEVYHADRSYQTAASLSLGLDLGKTLGHQRRLVVRRDTRGHQTVLSAADTHALIQNEYVGPDDAEAFYANLELEDEMDRSIKSEDEMEENEFCETEIVSDIEQEADNDGYKQVEDNEDAASSVSNEDYSEKSEAEPKPPETEPRDDTSTEHSPETTQVEVKQEVKEEEEEDEEVPVANASKTVSQKKSNSASTSVLMSDTVRTLITSTSPTNKIVAEQVSPETLSDAVLAKTLSTGAVQKLVAPLTLTNMSGKKLPTQTATGTKQRGTNVITLPPGMLLGGQKAGTTIHIPTSSSTTKTYMITKTSTGEIRKTPIILKTMPVTRKLTPLVSTSGSTGKVVTNIKAVTASSPQEPPPSAATDEDSGALRLLPTPSALNKEVLNVLVGKQRTEDPV